MPHAGYRMGEALKRLVSQLQPLVNCLHSLITGSRAPDMNTLWTSY